jgi:hypothetical protein
MTEKENILQPMKTGFLHSKYFNKTFDLRIKKIISTDLQIQRIKNHCLFLQNLDCIRIKNETLNLLENSSLEIKIGNYNNVPILYLPPKKEPIH